MPCSCSKGNKYVWTSPDGSSSMEYRSESEAAAAVRRNGGAYTIIYG